MTNAPQSLNAPTDPNPHDWLTEARLQQVTQLTSTARPLLIQSGLWRAALTYWVREQASLEANWESVDEKKKLDELEKQWLAKATSDQQGLDAEQLRAKLRVAPASARWSREQWGHRLDSLFLQYKSRLDRASCRIVRVGSKSLATELYYRVKAGESSFEVVARDFGEGPERHRNGMVPLQPLESMPFGLAPLLERLQTGQISQPMRLGKGFCLVELIEFQVSQLDDATCATLLGEQLRLWIDSVVDVLETKLR